MFGLLLLAFGLLVFSPLVEVREVKVVRLDARLDIEGVQKILTPFFGRHLFFLPTHEVKEVLEKSIKDVKDVKVSKNYPSELSVRIKLDPLVAGIKIREPDSVGEVFTTTGAAVNFLTDEGIYVIAPLPEGAPALPLISVEDWGVRPVEGDLLISPELFLRMIEAERSLGEQFGHTIKGRTVFIRAQEFHLHLKRGIDLWFDRASPLEDQLLRYRTFLRSVSLDEVEEYVDLRVSDRVVYK